MVTMMRDLLYGRFENVPVEDGEPVLDPLPKMVRVRLLGGRNSRRDRRHGVDFVLKKGIEDLFEIFDRERVLVIGELIIEDGLPVRITYTT
jgi:hypothetical protein